MFINLPDVHCALDTMLARALATTFKTHCAARPAQELSSKIWFAAGRDVV